MLVGSLAVSAVVVQLEPLKVEHAGRELGKPVVGCAAVLVRPLGWRLLAEERQNVIEPIFVAAVSICDTPHEGLEALDVHRVALKAVTPPMAMTA